METYYYLTGQTLKTHDKQHATSINTSNSHHKKTNGEQQQQHTLLDTQRRERGVPRQAVTLHEEKKQPSKETRCIINHLNTPKENRLSLKYTEVS